MAAAWAGWRNAAVSPLQPWLTLSTYLAGIRLCIVQAINLNLYMCLLFVSDTWFDAWLAGIGFGFMYLPSIVMVSFYFDKRRALATGIAVCGSGVGTFVLAPFFNFLVTEYGWKVSTINRPHYASCPSVCLSVRPSVRLSAPRKHLTQKQNKKTHRAQNVLQSRSSRLPSSSS